MSKQKCEMCWEPLVDCDAVIFPMPSMYPDLYFHEDCFENWIDEGKMYTYFNENGEEVSDD